MMLFQRLRQNLVILTMRPLISRETKGWGKLYTRFVGDASRNDFWQLSQKRIVRDKLHQFLLELDLSQVTERYTFFLGRWYDYPLQKLLQKVLQPGDEVIDVGADIGLFALAVRRCVGESGKISVIEPNPRLNQGLQRHIELNHLENIHIYPVALSNFEGTASLYFSEQQLSSGSLQKAINSDEESIGIQSIPVNVTIGDRLLPDAQPRLIKLDIEGAEFLALQGLAKLVEQHLPLIIYEFIPTQAQHFDSSFLDLWNFAQNNAYRIFKVGFRQQSDAPDVRLIPIEAADYCESGDLFLVHANDPALPQIQTEWD